LEAGRERSPAVRVAYHEIPRGSGKSTLAGGVAVNLAFFDGEQGSECYVAATKKDQAKITFEAARQMVLRSPKLRARIQVLTNNLHNPTTASKLEPLGADADSMDGLRVQSGGAQSLSSRRCVTRGGTCLNRLRSSDSRWNSASRACTQSALLPCGAVTVTRPHDGQQRDRLRRKHVSLVHGWQSREQSLCR